MSVDVCEKVAQIVSSVIIFGEVQSVSDITRSPEQRYQ